MNKWFYENEFYLTSDKSRIKKITDHYEIYKKVSHLEGDIIECGVFKGVSLIRFLTFRAFDSMSKIKKIYGFDIFGSFPRPKKDANHNKRDASFAKSHDKKIGLGIKKKKLNDILRKKGFKNFKLIEGDITETIEKFTKSKKKIKIALLHLDMDIYEPTKHTLHKLFKFIVKNGIILVDDYKHIRGATIAVDEFMEKNKKLKIQKISIKSRPSFIIKK